MSKKVGEILDLDLLKRVFSFSRPYKKQFYIAAIASILLSILGPLRPVLINYAIDNYILIPNKEKLLLITIALFFVLILEGVIQFYYIYISTWIGQNVIKDIRIKTYKHILSLRMKYFDNTPIGTLVTRTISDIETIADIFSQGLLVIIAELLKLTLVLVMMFYTDWKLTIISLLTVPFLLISANWFKKNIKLAFQVVREEVSAMNAFVQEHIVGMSIVQIFNKESQEYQKFKKINKKHQNAHLSSIFYYAVFFPIVEILSATSIGLIVWFGGKGIVDGESVTIGEIVAFILFIYMMFRPIRQLADKFNILQMGIVGSERVFKILDTKEIIKDTGKSKFTSLKGDIKFKNVFFSYDNKKEVISGINFHIPNGKLLALVGQTGSGKTTIINLLNRFYEIKSGKIMIDECSINEYPLSILRSKIALIQQEVFLFSDTIFNNITLYDDKFSRDFIINASKEIGIHKFIKTLPGSYDYIVGERGVTLSSGQRQLIAFLRIYIRNPKILILDEATSSIDSFTEQLLNNALKKISAKRTTIVIAHRLSTITNADKILHLSNGKVIEEGTHEELLLNKNEYAKMYYNQTKN